MKLHLKRIASPKTWKIDRKGIVWITRPNPGAHEFKSSMTLNLLLKEFLKITKTTKETKYVLNNQEILIDGVRKKDIAATVGLMDIVSLPSVKEHYRMLINKKGHLFMMKIEDSESNIKPCKLRGKTLIKGKKVQLNFTDGKCKIIDKDAYKIGDTVLMTVPENEIKEHFAFEKKSLAYLIGGNHAGKIGEIVDIKDKNILLKTKDGSQFETLKKYAFIIGKNKPCIKLTENE